jgi:hypothetical protein
MNKNKEVDEPPKKRPRQLRHVTPQIDGQLNLIDFYKRTSAGKPGTGRLPAEVNATNEGGLDYSTLNFMIIIRE